MGQATWSVWSPDPNNESLPNPGRFKPSHAGPQSVNPVTTSPTSKPSHAGPQSVNPVTTTYGRPRPEVFTARARRRPGLREQGAPGTIASDLPMPRPGHANLIARLPINTGF
jgi:hypothetical protein